MKRVAEIERDDEIEVPFEQEKIIQHYIHSIKELSGETVRSLMTLLRCEASELVNGLVYLREQIHKGKVKNAKGYLISSFDLNGKFKYKIIAKEYSAPSEVTGVADQFEYEVNKEYFKLFEKAQRNDRDNKFRFYYRENGTKLFIVKIEEAGRPRRVDYFLKRNKIDFKIVPHFEFQNV